MIFRIALLSVVLLNVTMNVACAFKSYTLNGEEADQFYKRFLFHYVKHQKEQAYKHIPLHGTSLLAFKSMIYVHCKRSMDPHSIDRLIANYQLTKQARYCKQLFVMLHSVIPEYERRPIVKIDLTLKEDGEILFMNCHSLDKNMGSLFIDREYFNKQPMFVQVPGFKIKGGAR